MSGAVIVGIALVGLLVDVCALKVAEAADERWPLGPEDGPRLDEGEDEDALGA